MPNRLPLRYFVEHRRLSPPSAGFGGVDAPVFRDYAAETGLLRNWPIRVELNPPAADGR